MKEINLSETTNVNDFHLLNDLRHEWLIVCTDFVQNVWDGLFEIYMLSSTYTVYLQEIFLYG